MLDGVAFAHPTPERVTAASASSSSLHTPTASEDGQPKYDHRASPGYTRAKPVPNLAAQIAELPTPTADDADNVTRDSGAYQSLTRAARRLSLGDPTPHPSNGGAE